MTNIEVAKEGAFTNRGDWVVIAEGIVTRKATINDADGITIVLESTKLGKETWKGNGTWVKKALKRSLSDGNNTIFVAEQDSVIIGFVDCVVFPSFWDCVNQSMINRLFVHDAYHNKGVGSKLIGVVTEWADSECIGEMHVSTEWDNVRAQTLWQV